MKNKSMKIINKNFSFLSFSSFFDKVAIQFSIFLFPLIAIYLYEANLMKTSLITFVTFIPNLLFSNHIGIFVDRHNKKKILLISNIISTILIFVLILSIFLKIRSFILFYFIIFLSNTIRVFYTLTYISYIPVLVEKENFRKANIVLEVINSFVQVIFPSLLGILINYVSLPMLTLGYGFSHILSMLGQLFINKEEEIKNKNEGNKKSYIKEILESYRFVFSHLLLKPIIICYIILVVSIGIFTSIQTFFILKTLKLDKSSLGLIIGLGNIGFFIGSFIASFLSKKVKIAKSILLSISFYFLGYISFYFFKSVYFLILGQVLISAALPVYNINIVTLRQNVTPTEKLASVSSIFRVCGRGLVPIGALIGGVLGTVISLKYTILIAAFIVILSAIPIVFSKNLMEGK
ncbi:MFS transporter [Streptobacillus moniliformis]|uniref:MFS transporter n=1 Tax=Streptobacillus moniliformis TaxID=34105 RepID=UPI0007E44910|nr:MFS transporter [Streptobacillus moniliformis]